MIIKGVNPAATYSVNSQTINALTTEKINLLNCFRDVIVYDTYVENTKQDTMYIGTVRPHYLSDAKEEVIFNSDRDFDARKFRINNTITMHKNAVATLRFRIKDVLGNLYWIADYYKDTNNLLIPYNAVELSSLAEYYKLIANKLYESGFVVEKITKVNIDLKIGAVLKITIDENIKLIEISPCNCIDKLINNFEKEINNLKNGIFKLDNPINIFISCKDYVLRNIEISKIYSYFILSFISKYNVYNYAKININGLYCISILPSMTLDKTAFNTFLNIIYSIAKMYNEEKEFIINENQRFAKEDEISNHFNINIKEVKHLFAFIKTLKDIEKGANVDVVSNWKNKVDAKFINNNNNKEKVVMPTKNIVNISFNSSDVFNVKLKSFLQKSLNNLSCKYKTINFYGLKQSRGTVVSTINIPSISSIENTSKYINTSEVLNIGLPYDWRKTFALSIANSIKTAIVNFIESEGTH